MLDSKVVMPGLHKFRSVCVYFFQYLFEVMHSIASKMAPHENPSILYRNIFLFNTYTFAINNSNDIPDKYPVIPKNFPLRTESSDSNANIWLQNKTVDIKIALLNDMLTASLFE